MIMGGGGGGYEMERFCVILRKTVSAYKMLAFTHNFAQLCINSLIEFLETKYKVSHGNVKKLWVSTTILGENEKAMKYHFSSHVNFGNLVLFYTT